MQKYHPTASINDCWHIRPKMTTHML